MDEHNRDLGRDRNPVTQRKHRREAFVQITLPMLIGGLILVILAGFSTLMETDEIGRWADISLIWLIPPVMVLTLITFVTLVASIYALGKLIQVLPFYSFRLHKAWIRMNAAVRHLSDRIVEPVLRANGIASAASALKHQLKRRHPE